MDKTFSLSELKTIFIFDNSYFAAKVRLIN